MSRRLKVHPPSTLLFSMYASLGEVAVLDIEAATNQAILAIEPNDDVITAPFLKWWLDHIGPQLHQFSKSSTQDNLSAESVRELPVVVPPLVEQNRVCAFLDRETARIDALIAKKERLLELLEEKRTSLLVEAVSGGLNPSVPRKESGVGWIRRLPMHWDVRRIKWVARMESGHTPDKKVTAYWTDGNIPWVSLNDTGYLKDYDYISETAYYTNSLGLENSSARLLPAGAVVFSRDATIGRCAITTRPMAVSQHFIAWLCGPAVLPEYLLLVLRSMGQELERLTMGATLRTIGVPDVQSLTMPLPPRKEQEGIVEFFRTRAATIDRATLRIRDGITLLREHRVALISAAVTGRLQLPPP
jgi:type I restriction enzyme S subunit